MIGRWYDYLMFQNLIGMLGSLHLPHLRKKFFDVSKPYRYARKLFFLVEKKFFLLFQNLIGMLGSRKNT